MTCIFKRHRRNKRVLLVTDSWPPALLLESYALSQGEKSTVSGLWVLIRPKDRAGWASLEWGTWIPVRLSWATLLLRTQEGALGLGARTLSISLPERRGVPGDAGAGGASSHGLGSPEQPSSLYALQMNFPEHKRTSCSLWKMCESTRTEKN